MALTNYLSATVLVLVAARLGGGSPDGWSSATVLLIAGPVAGVHALAVPPSPGPPAMALALVHLDPPSTLFALRPVIPSSSKYSRAFRTQNPGIQGKTSPILDLRHAAISVRLTAPTRTGPGR
ncbi:hypothetical protein [Streptosporangium sp. NPDC002607]